MTDDMKAPAHILFRVANSRWAVPVSSVQRVHDDIAIQSVPGTKEWFLGLAQVDGQLLSVTDLGAWSGFAAAAGAVLQIRSDIENCGLRVDEIIGTESVTATVSPVDGSDQSVMPGALSLVFDFKNERYRILDVAVLVQSPAFIDILEASPA